MADQAIAVTSHVGRDLLASAARFKSEAAVVWEYVVNSLQYVEAGREPKIQVLVQAKKRLIRIEDNGSGMDVSGLQHYFTMHGENLERRRGRGGRGKFGTGKSAAFGIASTLRISTRRDGLENEVELTRDIIEKSDGKKIPVRWVRKNEKTTLPNGTVVSIEGVLLDRIRENHIVEYIERHLQAFRTQHPSVAVNDHVCEYREPDVVRRLQFHPNADQATILGNVTLEVCVSRAPLEEQDCGIAVTAGSGNLVGQETCGIARKERGTYLFGSIDVPSLEQSDSKIQPYDDSRSLQLNPEHPVVRALIAFIGSKLEKVRLEEVEKYKDARRSEEARRLANEAQRIAAVLNDDFRRVSERIKEIRSAASHTGTTASLFGSAENSAETANSWVEGIQEPGVLQSPSRVAKQSRRGARAGVGAQRSGKPNEDGPDSVDPAGDDGEKRAKPKGGFVVEYANLGKEEARSRYDATKLAILINLDHPVVENAQKLGGIEDPAFKRLSYEIAFSEYAMALGYEMAQQDPDVPADDLLYEVRSTLNRIAKAAAALYE